MAVSSQTSLMPPTLLSRPESDDEESFVVLGHSLSPESTEVLQSDLADAIETSVVHDAVRLGNSSLERMNSSTPSFPFMQGLNPNFMVQARDVSINTIASADLSPDEVQQKVDMLVEENVKLKETLYQNNLAMKKQYDTLVLWQNDVMSVHKSHKEKFAETKSYIEKLKLEKAELLNVVHLKETEIAILKQQINEIQVAKITSNVKLISQTSYDNLAEFQLESANKKISELEQQLQIEKTKIISEVSAKEAFQQEMEELRADLDKAKLDNEQLDKNFNKQKRESESLQKILLDEIKILKDKVMTESTEKQNKQKVEEQLMAAQMHITELQLSSDRDKEVINSNEQNIQELNKQIKELMADILPLRLQVDVFSKDFETERQAKMALQQENAQMAADLQNLQKRNQHLKEEVERLPNHEYVYVAKEEAAAAPQQPTEYMCPKCCRKYPKYSSLEDHVYRCIPIDDLF